MNILMVVKTFPPRYAGASVQAIYLGKAFLRLGQGVDFLTNNFSNKSEVTDLDGMKVFKMSTLPDSAIWQQLRDFLFAFKTIWFILTHASYDVIFMHSVSGFDCFVFPVCKLFKRKSILELTLADNDDPLAMKKRKLGFLFYPAIKCTDKIVAISTRLFKLSVQAGVPKSQLDLIPVGVDTSRFYFSSDQDRQSFKEKLDLKEYKKVFLSVGQLEPRKGYDFLMRAWSSISLQIPQSIWLIAGPKNDESHEFYLELIKLIKEYKITNVRFLGLIQNVHEYLKVTDCLLHGALMEGLPNVLLEAGCSGVPIACRQIKDITSDIILNQNIGQEYAGDSPQEFANQVCTLLTQRNHLTIEDDIRLLKEKFDIDIIAQKYLHLFKTLS